MSEIEDQISVIEYIQLKYRLFDKGLHKDIEDLAKGIILDIVSDLEDTKDEWLEKWK